MGARNTSEGITGSSVTVRRVTTKRLQPIARGPLRGIVVVVVSIVVIVSALALQSIVVSVLVHPLALFVTGRSGEMRCIPLYCATLRWQDVLQL